MKPTEREQKLIDILFEVAIRSRKHLTEISDEEHMDWIRTNLKHCGFPVTPVGMSHGVLDKNQPED